MVALAKEWFLENYAVYFRNAANVRDFRSQLRGNKALFLWLAYMLLLVLIMSLTYLGVIQQGAIGIAAVQRQLNEFYIVIMSLLGGMIAIVTPALTATTVVSERQRRSLDLVFSAPVSMKYYLVGKMLSSLRYTWMLLILALPITSVCVVMGGATWQDVLAGYMILTGASLIFTALGLLISVVAPSLVSAVLWTYVFSILYCVVTAVIASIPSRMMMAGMSNTQEAFWTVALSPFMASFAAPTFTTLWGHQIPNWILGLIYSLIVCKLLLLGAASAMGGFGSKDTRSLRIHVAGAMLALGYFVSIGFQGSAFIFGIVRGAGGPTSTNFEFLAPVLGWFVVLICFSFPVFTCSSPDDGRKYLPDGYFRITRILSGAVSGSLPFALLMVVLLYGGCTLGIMGAGDKKFLSVLGSSLFWALCYTTLWWAVAQLISSLTKSLRAARIALTAVIIFFLLLPLPVLSFIKTMLIPEENSAAIYSVHLLYPLRSVEISETRYIGYGVFMLCLALILIAISCDRQKKRANQ